MAVLSESSILCWFIPAFVRGKVGCTDHSDDDVDNLIFGLGNEFQSRTQSVAT